MKDNKKAEKKLDNNKEVHNAGANEEEHGG